MIKRILPLVVTVALVVCLFAVTVSAESYEENGIKILDYMDFITAYDLSFAGDGWAYLSFGKDFLTSYKSDRNGFVASVNGNRSWLIDVENVDDVYSATAGMDVPGSYVNNTFLSLSNIPSGSRFWMQAFADYEGMSGYQTEFLIHVFSGVSYYDENFGLISEDITGEQTYTFEGDERFSQIVEITLNIPENAKYCTLFTRCDFSTGRTNDLNKDYFQIEFQFSNPALKISTNYTQIIIQSIINAKPPAGAGTIIDLDELEDILNNATGDGIESADQIIDKSPGLIISHASGFLFLSNVIERMLSVGWLDGILTVSLSLGILGFIGNIVASAGRSFEHKSVRRGGKA